MRILATGSSVPKKILTNADLETIIDTSDEWITTRTGIARRHIAVDESTLSLASAAAAQALSRSNIKKEEISVLICATVSNENRCPAIASLLQRELGLSESLLAFDINAACSGFIYALICAEKLTKPSSYALILGSEVLSRLTDYSDRSTAVLFGDAAAAAIVCPSDNPFYWVSYCKGDDAPLYIKEKITMDGQIVFKFAVAALCNNILSVVAKAGLELHQIRMFICHQANIRIIASAAKRLGLSLSRFFINLENYGNTSSASIPLALDAVFTGDLLKNGDWLVLAGFGGGLSAGACCLRWSDTRQYDFQRCDNQDAAAALPIELNK